MGVCRWGAPLRIFRLDMRRRLRTAHKGKLSLDPQLVQGHWLERGSWGGRGLRSRQGGAHCARSLPPHELGGSLSQGALSVDGSENKEWGA